MFGTKARVGFMLKEVCSLEREERMHRGGKVCVCPTSHVPDTDKYLFLCIPLASHLLEDE